MDGTETIVQRVEVTKHNFGCFESGSLIVLGPVPLNLRGTCPEPNHKNS
jgi:hypothetical protein